MRLIPLLLPLALIAWAGVACWNAWKPLPAGTHVTSLSARLAESQVTVLTDSAAHREILEHELAAIDRAGELIVLDATPLPREVGQRLLMQRRKRPNIKIVVLSDPRSDAYGGTPVEYFDSLERAGVLVARVRLERLRDSRPLYSALWRLTLGWWSNPYDESPGERGWRATLRARNGKADQRQLLVADDGAGGWQSIVPAGTGGDLALQVSGALARDIVASELKIAAWSSGDDRLPAPPPAPPGGVGSIDARFLTEGAVRGAVADTLESAAGADEVRIFAHALSDRRVIAAAVGAAQRGTHVEVLLDAGAPPNAAVAGELAREGRGRIELRWVLRGRQGASSALALVQRRGEVWLCLGAADFTRPALEDIDLEAAVELRMPERAAIARQVADYFDARWAAGASYAHFADESPGTYWRYRLLQATALADF
jgi:hypothetical protein